MSPTTTTLATSPPASPPATSPPAAHGPRVRIAGAAATAQARLVDAEMALGADTIPMATRELVRLRASQINGCGFCVDMHAHDAQAAGETFERLMGVAGWRDAPYFTEEERAALELTEAVTRLTDTSDPVPDELWRRVADYFDDEQLAALVMQIATINAWNRVNVATRQVAGILRGSAVTPRE